MHQPHQLRTLQAGRAMAAIFVAFYHVYTELFNGGSYWPKIQTFSPFSFGHSGVDYFFVLSGFVIYYVHNKDINRPERLSVFFLKRFSRIYPIYWLILIAVVLVGLLLPLTKGAATGGISNFLSSFFLIAIAERDYSNPQTIIPVAWTLFHEVMFYAVFSLLILNRKLGAIAMALWLAGSVFSMGSDAPTLLSVYFAPIHMLFLFGAIVGWFYIHREAKRPAVWLFLGIVLFFVTGYFEVSQPELVPRQLSSLPIGIASAMILFGAAFLERYGRLAVPAILVFLGNASYSIYLLHQPLEVLIAKGARFSQMFKTVPSAIWFWLIPIGAIGMASVFHVVVERRVLLFARTIPARAEFAPEGA